MFSVLSKCMNIPQENVIDKVYFQSPFDTYCWKMAKHTLKILQCEYRKVFKGAMKLYFMR